jgi:hypothetical protein
MTTPTLLSPEELTIALLDIKAKIAACHAQEGASPWLICATLRHTAEAVAARFVDPQWIADEEEDHA